jgi:hypothetical protein
MNLALRPATHEALERFRLRRRQLLQTRAILCGLAIALGASSQKQVAKQGPRNSLRLPNQRCASVFSLPSNSPILAMA